MALKVTQIRSAIGTKPKQRGTLRALGLGRIGRSNILPDRPEIHGMIHRVPHLVTVEDVSESGGSTTETVIEKPTDAPAKKAVAKKAVAKKAAKKTVKKAAKKTTAEKTAAKKTAAKKTAAKLAAKKSRSGSATSGGGQNEAT